MNHNISQPQNQWKGMTLDEIRYARVINEMRIMMVKEKLTTSTQSLMAGKSFGANSHSMIGRMLGALTWIDYGVLALRVTSKLSSIFKRKNK